MQAFLGVIYLALGVGCELHAARAAASVRIDVAKEYGIITFETIGKAMSRGLGITRGGSTAVVYLEAGTHIVDMAYGPLFNFSGAFSAPGCELVLAGAGMGATTLVARTHGYDVIHGIKFRGIAFENLTFARDPAQTTTQGRIVAIDGLSIEVEITPGFPELDALLVNRYPRIPADLGLFLRLFSLGQDGIPRLLTGPDNGTHWPPTANTQIHFSCGSNATNGTAYVCPDVARVGPAARWRLRALGWPEGELAKYEAAITANGIYAAIKVKHGGQAFNLREGDGVRFESVRWLGHSRGVVYDTDNIAVTNTRIERGARVNGVIPFLATNGGGPQLTGGTRVVYNVSVRNHTAVGTGDDSIALFNVGSGEVSGCNITDSYARGILLVGSDNVAVHNNTLLRCPIWRTRNLSEVQPRKPRRDRGARSKAMLFLDDAFVADLGNASMSLGAPTLVSKFSDPNAFIGWGYPSVWKKADGTGYRAMYQGWPLTSSEQKGSVRLALLADSPDGIAWAPANATLPAGSRPLNISNAVLDTEFEFSVVYADKHSGQLILLWTNTSVSTSNISDAGGGVRWELLRGSTGQNAEWTSEKIDPGFGLFRNPFGPPGGGEWVVTARPQSLRAGGRHAGFHFGADWASLAAEENQVMLPLDKAYAKDNQMYGVPSFTYGGLVISFVWKYACVPSAPAGKCYHGGNVSSHLGISHNARNWSQVPDVNPFFSDPASRSFRQLYANTITVVDDGAAKSLLIHASASTEEHGTVEPGISYLLTYRLRFDGFAYLSPANCSRATVTTVYVSWLSGELKVNAVSGGGADDKVLVQVVRKAPSNPNQFEPIEGFTFGEARAIVGNQTETTATWTSGKTLDGLAQEGHGKTTIAFQVQIVGSKSRLYSLRGDWTTVN